MNKRYKIIFTIWCIVSFYLVVVQKLTFGVVFFDIKSVGYNINLIPLDFLVHLLRNYSMALHDGVIISLSDGWFYLQDFISNILLFVPTGVCFMGMKWNKVKSLVVVIGIVLFYEFIQLSFRIFNIGTSVFDINDILAAPIGMWIGVLIYKALRIVSKKIKN